MADPSPAVEAVRRAVESQGLRVLGRPTVECSEADVTFVISVRCVNYQDVLDAEFEAHYYPEVPHE